MRLRPQLTVGAIALVAVALWPWWHGRAMTSPTIAQYPQPAFTMAPVTPDYRTRNLVVGFWERRARATPTDQIILNALSGQYLQRYRETGDLDDVRRAEATARRSLAIMPRGNFPAEYALSSALLTFHKFREALAVLPNAVYGGPSAQAILKAKQAGLELELGHDETAEAELTAIPAAARNTPTVQTVQARYDELHGRLATARRLLERAAQYEDTIFDAPAQTRAAYHERLGEMAFHAGDSQRAIDEEQIALTQFPNFNVAHTALARFALAAKRYDLAYDEAAAAAKIVPLPETLGYQADAALGLHRNAEAAALRDEIFAVAELGNAYHTSDRFIAMYYADHRLRPQTALAIAQHDVAVRGREVYAQDTLAWAALQAGRMDIAARAAALSTRFGTEDALLDYHAAVIAERLHEKARARQLYHRALALNPEFHPRFAGDARARLAAL